MDQVKQLVGLNSSTAEAVSGSNQIGNCATNPQHSPKARYSNEFINNRINHDLGSPIDHRSTNIITCTATIEGETPSSTSKAQFTRGHRRRSTHVTRRDLEKFQTEVLGVENHANYYEEDDSSAPLDISDPEFDRLNLAFEQTSVSMNGMPGNQGGLFPGSYTPDSSPGTPNMANMPRQAMSPALPVPGSQMHGGAMAAINGNIALNAGHQMDLHHLYDMVLELSEVLKNNREVTKNIVSSAEEIMTNVDGLVATRISELERALAKEKRQVEHLKNEQIENTRLIGDYETAVGTMVEQVRNYCQNNNMHYLSLKGHYNNLLQAERDAHLESRLDRDYWHAQTMKCAEMIRTAHRLRSEEEDVPIRIVTGLQNEVRAYRNALGMEVENPEDEYGWEILKDIPQAE
ncbi:hypothetical protein N7495_002504 [Penicillium taxi]|uniref:uncharacterized protein n=1 Tax=Penicillium taxi TaxID=168475 RepID=UPI0025452070|nr:uncharacterized protein N7495_002504 [Penicillium taxi]KAJ5901976.1 hypothetical protein N7495_002504 [Penicillium taxi]